MEYWSFSFSISPTNEYSGLISFRMDWLDPCSLRDSQECSPTPQFRGINSSALSFLYSPTLTSIHDYWKTHSFDQMDLCQQSDVSAFQHAVQVCQTLLFSFSLEVKSQMGFLWGSGHHQEHPPHPSTFALMVCVPAIGYLWVSFRVGYLSAPWFIAVGGDSLGTNPKFSFAHIMHPIHTFVIQDRSGI